MKNALILVISPLFLIGVIGDKVKSVSVKEGYSITLHTDVTEIQTDDEIEWRLNGNRTAKFSNDKNVSLWIRPDKSDKLKLNSQTGDLKIRNIKTTDSGTYKLKISTTRGSEEKIFNVSGVLNADKDPVKSVTVGESVKLKTEKQSDEVMKWRFGPQNTVIAELKVSADSFTVYDDVLDGRFRDRLKLDNQTGSLNITNTTTEHDGVYEAEIRGSGYTIHETFSVTVTDVKSMLVKEGGSATLHTGLTHIQRNDVILWRFGDQGIIARLNGPDVYQTWSNVYLNDQTGDLNIGNIRGDQFGDYKVEINTINMISHRKYNISETVDLVLVMEGDSVTLHTGVTKIPRDNAVLWFGDKGARITPLPGPVDPRWSNTEQNNQTGELTIRNIRRDQSGDYKVIFMNFNGESKHRKFHLNIIGVLNTDRDTVKSVTAGESVNLKTKKQSDEVMKWRFGPQNTVIAELKVPADRFTVYDDVLDGRFRNRLELDNDTGSLTITDIRTTDSGVYEADIRRSGSGYTIHETFSVTVTGLSTVAPDSGLSTVAPVSGLPPGAVAGIVVPVVVLLVSVVVGVIYRYYRSSKTETHSEVNGQNHTSNKDEETELTKPAEAAE